MSREEGGHHPQLLHLVQLVQIQQLGMDHHWPLQMCLPFPLQLLQHGQVLPCRRVAVAVCQQLHPLVQGQGHPVIHLPVGEDRVAPVLGSASQIGGAHPGGASLRRAVQKYLIPPQLEMAAVRPDMAGERLRRLSVGISVAHHVQPEQVPLQQLAVEGDELVRHHPLLYCGHAVGGIAPLGLVISRQQVFCVWQGHPLLELQECVLLHISGELPVRAPLHPPARRARGLLIYPQPLQCQGVKDPHVS